MKLKFSTPAAERAKIKKFYNDLCRFNNALNNCGINANEVFNSIEGSEFGAKYDFTIHLKKIMWVFEEKLAEHTPKSIDFERLSYLHMLAHKYYKETGKIPTYWRDSPFARYAKRHVNFNRPEYKIGLGDLIENHKKRLPIFK